LEVHLDVFYNEDSRLRPRIDTVPNIPPSGPREYLVNEKNYPDLHMAFEQMQRDAGISGYSLLILGDEFGSAGGNWDRHAIGIGIHMINDMKFDEVVAVLGHELGHIYRHQHPDAPFVGLPTPGLSSKREAEIEADRLGACLVGEKEATIGALLHGGVAMDPGLPNNLRIDEVSSFPLANCPVGKGKQGGIQ
jgi:Peptidase family M48